MTTANGLDQGNPWFDGLKVLLRIKRGIPEPGMRMYYTDGEVSAATGLVPKVAAYRGLVEPSLQEPGCWVPTERGKSMFSKQ